MSGLALGGPDSVHEPVSGGLILSLCSDIVVAADSAVFQVPEASVGHPLAMYRLARLLKENGRPDESERWLRRAAEAGHPGALYTLGKLTFEQGRQREAGHWLRGAADAGHAKIFGLHQNRRRLRPSL